MPAEETFNKLIAAKPNPMPNTSVSDQIATLQTTFESILEYTGQLYEVICLYEYAVQYNLLHP